MKRFWLVLLSLGLIMAFSASAFAVDIKISGDIEFAGLYVNKATVADVEGKSNGEGGYLSNPNSAFYYQRMRFGADFIVAPCLKLVTQFDTMDRIWGGARSDADSMGWAYNQATSNNGGTAGTRAESENFVMNLAYIEYTSPIGLFKVGYQNDFVFGTVFGDRAHGTTSGQIQYFIPVGPVTLFAGLAKEIDNSASAVTYSNLTDNDFDSYRIAAIYGLGKKIEGGALLLYNRDAEYKAIGPSGLPFLGTAHLANVFNLVPYFKAQVGPVALQGELNYGFGNVKMEDNVTGHDLTVNTLSVFLDATANLGMVYVGGSFAYVSGQDPNEHGKIQSGLGNTGGLDWNPCLIMFNTDLEYWGGDIYGHSESVVNGEMVNAYFFQGRVGVKPIPALDIKGSVSFATADKKPDPDYHTFINSLPNPYPAYFGGPYTTTQYGNGNYGVEVDITGTYKITNNLSYMLGFGYLFTGDYFKGYDYAGQNYKTVDDYMLINKLVLSF
jgi:hypothetical protein